MAQQIDADYVVVGAGATGLAFADALIDHSGATVVIADRRHSVGGHWLEAYPFVRLHQASVFYGVASTLLGGGQIQQHGPEQGLHERASQPAICEYYQRVLDRLLLSRRVEFLPLTEVSDRTLHSRLTGVRRTLSPRCRLVDARYRAPLIPAEVPPPFAIEPGARVVSVNDLPRIEETPGEYVVVGSGKTATDAIVWLLGRGVDPGSLTWVRPRDPWMLNRATVQPDPAVIVAIAADVMEAASAATSLDDLFLRLEDAGVMMRIDRGVLPTMAKTPTLATWELELLRSVEHVVRRGHLLRVAPGELHFTDGTERVKPDALVVHCAADGLPERPTVPVWGRDTIVLQPTRSGFPCFGAALIGYVEATRDEDDEKNRLCPASAYGNTLAQWARMNVQGIRSTQAFSSQPDIVDWVNSNPLNPARIPPGHPGSPALDAARERLGRSMESGLVSLAAMAG